MNTFSTRMSGTAADAPRTNKQVIVGFIGGACIAIVFLALYYFWAYDAVTSDAAPVNPVDDWVLRSMRSWARKRLPQLAARLSRNRDCLTEALGEASSVFVRYQLRNIETDYVTRIYRATSICAICKS